MSLHKKTLIVVGVTFAFLIAILTITSKIFVLGGFVNLEAEDARINVARGVNEISNEMKRLDSVTGDWAPWDATCDFIQEKSEGYIEENLTIAAVVNLGVDFVLFFDHADRLKYDVYVDLSTGKEIREPPGLLEEIHRAEPLLRHDDTRSRKTGVIVAGGTPVLVASQPIVKTDFSGPIRGTMILGKMLNAFELQRLSESLRLTIDVQALNRRGLPADYQKARASFSEKEPIFVAQEGRESITGYTPFKDILGRRAFILKIKLPRKIYQQGLTTFYYYTWSMIFIGLFFIFMIMFFLEKTVLFPLSRLSAKVRQIGAAGDFKAAIPVLKNDELGVLANEINVMLKHIDVKTTELSGMNKELRYEIEERKKVEKAILESDERLREQNRAIVELSKLKLGPRDGLNSALKRISEKVAAILGVERISVWRHGGEGAKLRCMELYEAGEKTHSDGMELSSGDHPEYFKLLKEDRTIAVHDAFADPRTRAFAATWLKPLGVSAMLDAPIRIGGLPAGVLRVEHTGAARSWTIDEQSFSASIADLVSLSIETFERKQAEEERKKLEAQLQRAEKMEIIGNLAGGVAHDLNNILSGLVTYPELLLLELPPDSEFRKPVSIIKRSGERASAIVQDLLTLTRRGVAVTDVVNLNDIISDYLESPEHESIVSSHPETRIETDFEPDLLNIAGSPAHLSKSVMNLVSNAAEAMPSGGVIRVTTRNRCLETPISGYDQIAVGDHVVFSVSDTGSGVSPEDKKRIFEPFYTKKIMRSKGSGLGMSVVWGTVKDHNGYIDVQSVEGEGATFTLYFPVAREESSEAWTHMVIGDYLGRGESILVVDDVEEQREIAGVILKKLGYRVESVESGEAAAAYLENNAVDLIVLDMIMDPGMDGLDAYKRIIQLHPGQKAIIASGFSETDRVKEALELGAGEYVKKPYSLKKIGVAVRKELDRTG
ncbi:MAG: response regulator [Desulfobacterales bacterium]|nr:response regulator [Desulfobacterales bacterium]